MPALTAVCSIAYNEGMATDLYDPPQEPLISTAPKKKDLLLRGGVCLLAVGFLVDEIFHYSTLFQWGAFITIAAMVIRQYRNQ